MSEHLERNKEIVRRYQDAYNACDLDVLDELLTPDWKTNAFPKAVMDQTIENAKAVHVMLTEALHDLHVTTHELIAEGDVVVQSWTARGIHKGDLVGLAPTGNAVVAGGVSIFEIRDGRIVRHEAFNDVIPVLDQCGAELPPEWVAFGHAAVDA